MTLARRLEGTDHPSAPGPDALIAAVRGRPGIAGRRVSVRLATTIHGMPIGIDLLEIERMEQALERRPGLALRLFTEGERAYSARRARPGQHLAARFCAKEAVAKALRLEAWNPQDIEVVGEGAQTTVALHGSLAALGVQVDVSLTHSKATAGAVALVR